MENELKDTPQGDILIVDDNPENLKVLTNFLRPEGYRIRIARSGRQALENVSMNAPSLVLMDIQMPEMDGLETCAKLKENGKNEDLPVIFISALSETEDKLKAFEAGGVDYIEKPFHLEEVLARVTTHMTIKAQKERLKKANLGIAEARNQLTHAEKMVSLGVMSAGIAHEINNPINYVITGAAALEMDLKDLMRVLELYDNIELEKYDPSLHDELVKLKEEVDFKYLKESIMITIKDMKLGAEKTANIVKGLKRFSRIDNEDKFDVDINDELDNTINIVSRLTKKNVQFQCNFDKKVKLVHGFPGKLSQLFMNIITNAEQAVEEEGLINVSTEYGEMGVDISISDNGHGIPEEIGDRIYDPFLTTKEVGKGTGLGLSISYGIVKDHHGKINYLSEQGKGTTFNIFIPYKNG